MIKEVNKTTVAEIAIGGIIAYAGVHLLASVFGGVPVMGGLFTGHFEGAEDAEDAEYFEHMNKRKLRRKLKKRNKKHHKQQELAAIQKEYDDEMAQSDVQDGYQSPYVDDGSQGGEDDEYDDGDENFE